MSNRFTRPFLAFVALLAWIATAAGARAETLAPGAERIVFNLPDPNVVNVIQVQRNSPDLELSVGFPYGRRNYPAKQTTSAIASLYDKPPAFDALAGVNACFFGTGIALTGVIHSGGEIIQTPTDSYETFAFTQSRGALLQTGVTLQSATITFADGSTAPLDLFNQTRQADTIVCYTPVWGPSTDTTAQGIEVIVEGASGPMRAEKEVAGRVTAVRTGAASLNNPIPAGGFVLAARDSKVTTLQSKIQVGDRIRVRFDYSANLWNNAQISLTGRGWLLSGGQPQTSNFDQYSSSFRGRNPRTCVAWNATHYFLVTVDGRQAGYSVGMSLDELAEFLRSRLGATDAVNLDGGGSTAMWVNGALVNRPSDATGERSVGNALLLARRPVPAPAPMRDDFPATGRALAWDDKFTFNDVEAFAPAAPGGDGYALRLMDPAGGFETARIGHRAWSDYAVEAAVYCPYRPGDAANGYERVGIFARDDGDAAFTTTFFGAGSCYALTCDSDTGRVRAGVSREGTFTDALESTPLYLRESGWHGFRISCLGPTIRFFVDGELIATLEDASLPAGMAGLGYWERFTDNAAMQGGRFDNFRFEPLSADSRSLITY